MGHGVAVGVTSFKMAAILDFSKNENFSNKTLEYNLMPAILLLSEAFFILVFQKMIKNGNF